MEGSYSLATCWWKPSPVQIRGQHEGTS